MLTDSYRAWTEVHTCTTSNRQQKSRHRNVALNPFGTKMVGILPYHARQENGCEEGRRVEIVQDLSLQSWVSFILKELE